MFLTLQFAVAVGGAVTAFVDPTFGLMAALAALAASAVTHRLGEHSRDQAHARKREADALALVGLISFVYALFLTGKLLPALGLLLIFAQLSLNLLLREHRQLYFSLIISFILVLGGASMAKSGWYLAIFGAYGLSTSLCLSAMWRDRQWGTATRHAQPIREQIFVPAALLGLATLFYLIMPRPPAANLGERLTDTSDYYASEEWEAEADWGSRRDDTTNTPDDDASEEWEAEADGSSRTDDTNDGEEDGGDASGDRNEQGDGAGTTTHAKETDERFSDRGEEGNANENYRYPGFDSDFDIEQAGQSTDRNSNRVVAYMKAQRGGYLKVRTFDQFDGMRWSRTQGELTKKRVWYNEIDLLPGIEGNFRQAFTIEQNLPPWLPAASQPAQLYIPASVIALDAWGHPLLPGMLRAGTQYTVASYVEVYAGRPVGGPEPPRDSDLQLPADLDPRIAALARQVTAGQNNTLDRAVALEVHLRSNYRYSFDSIFESQGVTPLPRFLFQEKSGHCEYFASAMAVMLRTLGVPARLITGFSATRKNPMTGYFEIRALDGHAWVEAWIDGRWVTFEPTAFYQLPDQENPSALSAEQINDYVENLIRDDNALGDQEMDLRRLPQMIWHTVYALIALIVGYLRLALSHAWPYLTALGLPAFGLFLTRNHWLPPLQVAWSRRQIRRYRGQDAKPAMLYYLWRLQRIAAHHHVTRRPAEDIQSWTRRLETRFGDHGTWRQLADLVDSVFYEEQQPSPADLQTTITAAADLMRPNESRNRLS